MKNVKRDATVFGSALLLLCLISLLSLRFGSTYLTWSEFFGGLFSPAAHPTAATILRAVRLPRLLGGLLAGAGLALSGSLLQRVTDNPLAAPGVLGLNAGAGFFVILTLACLPAAHALLPLAAFVGAMLAALLLLALSARFGFDKLSVMLAGVALSALLGAGISFLSVLDSDALISYTEFSIGGLRYIFLEDLAVPALILALCFACALLLAGRLQLFCLGDSLAASLGVNVKRVRLLCLVLAAASAAAAVSFAGLLGYVGLLVPHVTRKLTRGSARRELMLSPIGGAILLVGADLTGRLVFAPTEVPVGIFTALLGVPFFLILLLGRKRHAGM